MAKQSSNSLQERLLPDDDIEDEPNSSQQYRRLPKPWELGQNVLGVVMVSLLFYIAVVLTIQLSSAARCKDETERSHGPHVHHNTLVPSEVLQYERVREWTPEPQHPWNLEPSDELDAAWKDLLHAQNIRITPHELDALSLNKTNRVQVDNGDYLGVLGVYHHLHCLDSLRRMVHWDYYGPRLLADSKHKGLFISKKHSNHCIDSIRLALMCHANTAAYTAEWVEDRSNEGKNVIDKVRPHAVTTCVNWDGLDNWARRRALVPGQYRFLPGPSFK